jgi:transcriptional regulator with XRE-family HTH domain
MRAIRLERIKRGLTQEGLGRLANVPRTQVSMIECGVGVPWPGYMKRLVKVLDWKGDPADLLKEVEL